MGGGGAGDGVVGEQWVWCHLSRSCRWCVWLGGLCLPWCVMALVWLGQVHCERGPFLGQHEVSWLGSAASCGGSSSAPLTVVQDAHTEAWQRRHIPMQSRPCHLAHHVAMCKCFSRCKCTVCHSFTRCITRSIPESACSGVNAITQGASDDTLQPFEPGHCQPCLALSGLC